jgi:hypothetical protein
MIASVFASRSTSKQDHSGGGRHFGAAFGFCGLVAALGLFNAGCGGPDGPPTYPVKGKVTLDGTPLKEGEVFFHDSAKVVDSDHGKIVDGVFEFRSKAGPHRVEITAFKQVGTTHVEGRPDKSGAPIMEPLVPPQYNIRSTLTADVQAKDVNEFTFDLKSK